jgi:probable HAF family extracellular repeat protein
LVGGNYREVLPRGFTYSVVNAVNNSGNELGIAFTTAAITFLFNQGQFRRSGLPPIYTPHGLNDMNAIVGEYISANNTRSGFLFQNGTFQRLRFPSCPTCSTYAYGINTFGVVVGYFTDSSNDTHGFTWTPSADAAGK